MKNLLVLISLMFCIQISFSQTSSIWRGQNRDGIYAEKNLLKSWPKDGLKLLWKYDELGLGFTSVAIHKENIFITGVIDSTGYIYALTQDGKLKWKKKYGPEWTVNFLGSRSTPVIFDDYGYILSGKGVLYCFKTKNGKIEWEVDLYKQYDGREVRFGITENLLIDKNKLICTPGGENDNVIALDRFTGKLLWKSKGVGETNAYGTPVIVNHNGVDYLIVVTAKSIMSLNPVNGKLVWSFDLINPTGIHGNAPVYKDGYIFAMNAWKYGSVMLKMSEDGKSVKQVWRSKYYDLEHGDVVLMNGNIYGADYTSKLFLCTDWKTGTVKDSIKDISPSSVIAADGMIYCYTYNGELALVKPTANSFEIVGRFKTPTGPKRDHIAFPVISKGRLFVRYANQLLVYSIKK